VIKNSGQIITELDPTLIIPLQQLKEQVLAAPGVQDFLKDLNSTRISLVLSGGGGKGAYQAGAILALFDCGIDRFNAFCGTSVGALNAAVCHELCRLRDRNLVVHIWGRMSRQRVLRPSWLIFWKLALFLEYGFRNYNPWSPINYTYNGLRDEMIKFAHWLVAPLLIILFAFGFEALGLKQPSIYVLITMLFVGLILMITPLIMLVVKKSPSLFSNAPLRTMISEIDVEALRTSKVPIVCTLALSMRQSILQWTDIANLRLHYAILNNMTSREEVTQALLQSAALPEVFPARQVNGEWCIDGGLVDNCPILSAILFGALPRDRNTLIAVYLDAKYDRVSNLVEMEKSRAMGIFYSQKLPYEADFIEMVKQQIRECRLITIIPSAPLGNLITGTMNFSVKKAKELIEMGYRDTLILIQNLSKQAVSQ
jgi:predicted acylesterase/phospholipase RssA